MPALVAGIHVLDNAQDKKTWMAGHRRAEATPSFGRLCPANEEMVSVMNYWLVKSEPSAWSWDQQVAKGAKGEAWTGVRNFTARQNLVNMKKGDKAFFYHSNEGKEIVGIAEIIKEAYPDPSDKTGKFVCVDIKADKPLPKPVTMAAIKADKKFAAMALVKYSRLSVQPVTADEWKAVCRMAGL
jgi:predicted RNA-binding protein with PUA-like domain